MDRARLCGERSIFVLEIRDRPCFAFEAETLDQAERLVQASAFWHAFNRFWTSSAKGVGSQLDFRARTATANEASVYETVATEFAGDYTGPFFVHLATYREKAQVNAGNPGNLGS